MSALCDVSFSTFMLSHWVPGRRGQGLPWAQAIEMTSARNADYLGLADRGSLALGLCAYLNVIDPGRLYLDMPQLLRDLPGGGKRFFAAGAGLCWHLGH